MLSQTFLGHRYFIEFAFNGTPFHGWQVQSGQETVQEVLNTGLDRLLGTPVSLVGCGRTDAGVHASHFVAHFDVCAPVDDCRQLAYRLNRYLNKPIRIDRIVEVAPDAHARYSAVSRTYHYLVATTANPFMRDFAWEFTLPLDVAAMNEACRFLPGKKDFKSFCKLHSDVKNHLCEVYEAAWSIQPGFLIFRIRADRFLRNMVRAIVGTLVEVGKGRIDPTGLSAIMEAGNRSDAGMSVPGNGLFLTRVDYPVGVFEVEPQNPFPDWLQMV
jgi:tRNA pseudouridine38-40 synthase